MISSGLFSFLERTPNAHVFEEILPSSFARDDAKLELESFAVDFAITSYPVRSPIIDTCKLYSDHFLLISPKSSPISARSAITEAEVSALPLIIAGNRHRFDALYEGPNFSYQVVFEGEDIIFALGMVNRGLGYMILSQADYGWLRSSGFSGMDTLAPLPITKNGRPVPFDIYLSKAKGRALPNLAEQLVAHLSEHYK